MSANIDQDSTPFLRDEQLLEITSAYMEVMFALWSSIPPFLSSIRDEDGEEERYRPPGIPTTLDKPSRGFEESDRLRNSSEFCRTRTGLEKEVFWQLKDKLDEFGLSDNCRIVHGEQKLLIYLEYMRSDTSFRQLRATYQHSLKTFTRVIKSVNECLLLLYEEVVTRHIIDTDPAKIHEDPRWGPFQGAVGALDGTHINMTVPAAQQSAWRNRKGFLSTNVLAVCDFEGYFTYALAGWEGSAHDSRVLNDARTKGFRIPPGSFYLADAGYGSHNLMLVVPYQKVAYHLREHRAAARKPTNARELFNLRHAQLRNVVECVFGILKARFRVLSVGMRKGFAIKDQTKTIYALMALHNFLNAHSRQHHEVVQAAIRASSDRSPTSAEEEGPEILSGGGAETRQRIAAQCWSEYTAIMTGTQSTRYVDDERADSDRDSIMADSPQPSSSGRSVISLSDSEAAQEDIE